MNKVEINKAPKIAEFFLKLFLNEKDKEHRLGDFQETYEYILANKGKYKAVKWYWFQLLKSIPLFFFININCEVDMFKNYVKIAFRNLYKTKINTAINIVGLAVGLMCCMIIFLYVSGQFSYDSFQNNPENLYRMNWEFNWNDNEGTISGTPPPLAAAMVNEIPGVKSTTRIFPASKMVVHFEDKFFSEDKILGVDSNFLSIFSYKLINGNPQTALSRPGSVVLTEKTAEKYFGTDGAMGKTLILGKDNEFLGKQYSSSFIVTGIVQNPPHNSHIQFDFLTSMSSHPQVAYFDWSWIWMNVITYAVIEESSDLNILDKRMKEMVAGRAPQSFKRVGFSYEDMIKSGGRWDFKFQSFTDIYLNSENIGNRLGPIGNRTYLYMFISVAIFILLIACINFMNLSTARSLNRAKEIGVRKVLGSQRKNLIAQFMSEAILLSFSGLAAAVLFTLLLRTPFENLTGANIQSLSFSPFQIAAGLFLFAVTVGILAGSYPSFFLSSFKPVEVLRGKLIAGKINHKLVNTLVVLQFAISITLIISTLVVYNQTEFLRQKDLGFDKNNLIVISNENHLLGEKAETFVNILKSKRDVIDASLTSGVPPYSGFGDYYKGEGYGDEQFELFSYMADANITNTMGIDILEGRGFSEDFGSNTDAVIINERAAKLFKWEDPIGKTINYPGLGDLRVIGLMKDFNFFSLHSPILPFALFHNSSNSYDISESYIIAKLNSDNLASTVEELKNEWNAFVPGTPFEYSFLDEVLNSQYESEQRLGTIFLIFASLAIFIASLGLLGLAAYTTERRKREIGIRKTLGATSSNVLILLTSDFAKWVLIANVIAFPAAYYLMNNWLQEFAYRIDINYWIFIISGISALLISLLTVSYQSMKAALQNPVEVIKNE